MPLVIAVVAGITAIVLVLLAVVRPELHIWPPGRVGSIQWYLVWGLILVGFTAMIVAGVVHWNQWGWPAWLRWGVGGVLVLAGNGLAWWGVGRIGLRNATGAMEGGLARDGLYRYTRNPQYLGDIAILVGWAVLAASPHVVLAILPGVIAFLLTPLPEERALEEKFGEPYRRYREEVPRFLGRVRRS
jgi:protein-S-isoprenylcysteine O-methyltransferase Ste14